jgi:N-acyl-D-aspartate/D-glutamate deacylase
VAELLSRYLDALDRSRRPQGTTVTVALLPHPALRTKP